jgi:hypothetical protein
MRFGRLDLGRQLPAEVALLSQNLEFWPEFLEVTSGFGVTFLETRAAPIPVRSARLISHNRLKYGMSVGWSAFGARLAESGVRVLLGTDQTREPFEIATQLVPEVEQLMVAHGSVRSVGLLKHNHIERAPGRTLCVWGQHDADLYQETFPDAVNCVVTGSLRNAMHIQMNGLDSNRTPTKPLLFVSQYAGFEKERQSNSSNRNRVLRLLEQHVGRYCREQRLPLLVALRPPVSGTPEPGQTADEMRHFHSVFDGIELSFTNPSLRYSTYIASDEADVTIGVPSGSLTESFARRNKVLMVQQLPASNSHFSFPKDGDWLLTEPSYGDFWARLKMLQNLSRLEATNSWKSERQAMVFEGESDFAISKVKSILEVLLT